MVFKGLQGRRERLRHDARVRELTPPHL